MGMNGQDMANIQQGIGLIGDLVNTFNPPSSGGNFDVSGENEERAKNMELDTREQALSEKNRARRNAMEVRESREHERARGNAEWGRSGLSMGGSAELVRQGRQTKDKQEEDDILFNGDMQAEKAMDKGMRQANLFRIESGAAPAKSTLSLGSKLYNNRR